MRSIKISPGGVRKSIALPPSKSHTMRALLFGALGRGKTIIHNPLSSPDTTNMIAALRKLGVQIEIKGNLCEIWGTELKPCAEIIDAGNSGQVLRFIGALAAHLPTYTVITGDHSICHNRPVAPLLDALQQLGAFAVSTKLDGHAPIIVKGMLKPGAATLDGSDSQPVSAVLMTAAFLEGVTELHVTNPGETPWIELTLAWLRRFGLNVHHENYTYYRLEGPLAYDGFEYTVPGDFSSAAFPLIAALITGSEITLSGVDMEDVQGDKKIVDIVQQMGARIEIDPRKKLIHIKSGAQLLGGVIDADLLIDAVPILAVLGCFCSKGIEIVNAEIARKKESDRLKCITLELKKMGAIIEERRDGLKIFPSHLKGAHLQSHKDHRIAMALSVAALGAKGESLIDGMECIDKSYPRFVEDVLC